MFDLEAALKEWRANMEREATLSPREVDELEDHLRASIDLELELDPDLPLARAFSLARDDIGEPRALSSEFAKAGNPRWRRMLLVGCAMFVASWFLPVLSDPLGHWWGWEAFLSAILSGNPIQVLSALTNILMVSAMYLVGRGRAPRIRWLTWCVTGAAALNLIYWMRWEALAVGFWVWAGSFACAATALWIRDRQWVSARVLHAPE